MRAGDRYGEQAAVAGYGDHRPPVHAPLVAAALDLLGPPPRPRRRIVDLGCGAGASTAPLVGLAPTIVALDPVPAMVAATRARVPGVVAAVGRAEFLPVVAGTAELILAAGSLDHADLRLVGPEVARALEPDGALVVYDFARGRRLADRDSSQDPLDHWYDRYLEHSGRPPQPSDLPDRLAEAPGLRLATRRRLVVSVPVSRTRYIGYVLSDAADPGDPDLRAWCAATLPSEVDDDTVIAFDAYVAVLHPERPARGGG